jgi:preprotein translocase subunit SecA
VQRKHYFAIVDEVDNILIDEARTPLIISGPAHEDAEWYIRMAQVVRKLRPEHYEINEKDRSVALTEEGQLFVEEDLDMQLRDPERPEDVTPVQAQIMGHIEQALRAQFLFHRNKDYIVQAGKVIIIDEFTGRLMPGRRWSDGLHQAVEAKEGARIQAENMTHATITIQNYFRMYEKLAGMSGTALTESEEFYKIYKLEVVSIPTNLEYNATRSDARFTVVDSKDEQGYKVTYFAQRGDGGKKPLFWRRKDYPDVVYRTEEAKLRAITREIIQYNVIGRPQLIGTTSVEHSERLSARLSADIIRRLLMTVLIRDHFMEKKNIEITERVIPELQPLNQPLEKVEINALRKLSRELDLSVSFNIEEKENIDRLMAIFALDDDPQHRTRFMKIVQGGVTHQVLNARKHDEEAAIIAKAGAFSAVTIATNMAGRGVDIKLGGELNEEDLRDSNRVLRRNGYDAFNMTHQERREALQKMSPGDYGIYGDAVNSFLRYMNEMDQVRELGGLHVIGSERHEARRIDNQLRGRSSRQGDPGSSRFYLSLDDELMRLFGGKQVEGLMGRLNIDESMPIESGIVGRLVEQSQTRVEGSNFDIRKHLLEYDDVLNAQRKRIYDLRERIFTKEDLSEDLADMLRTELQRRVPQALEDEEGPWKLVAYIDDVQPSIQYEHFVYPSFSMRLLIDELLSRRPEQGATASMLREELISLARRAIEADRDHILNGLRRMLDNGESSLENQRQERVDALDAFFDTLDEREDEGPVRPQEIAEELASLVRLPQFRMTGEMSRLLNEDPEELRAMLRKQIEEHLQVQIVKRIAGAMERRIGDSLNINAGQMQDMDWTELGNQFFHEVESLLERQYHRLLGDEGLIIRDLDTLFDRMRIEEFTTDIHLLMTLLNTMREGTRMFFDRKTHRRRVASTLRLNYAFLAGQLLQGRSTPEITDLVLEQLEGAQDLLNQARGHYEWTRLISGGSTIDQLEEGLQARLQEEIGPERFAHMIASPLLSNSPDDRLKVQEVLGWFRQNDIARQLLLSVITNQWIDYLTKVEALRVSIGLEAYGQRDPLVQYKSRASEMFKELMADIRSAVISRLFTFRQHQETSVLSDGRGDGVSAEEGEMVMVDEPVSVESVTGAPASQGQGSSKNKKKRKRH